MTKIDPLTLFLSPVPACPCLPVGRGKQGKMGRMKGNFKYFCLEFEICLRFGIWDLEFY
jgi:hypothetical protein